MKRNLTVVCVLTGLCVALFAAVSVLGFVYSVLPVGIVGVFLTLVAVWVLIGSVYRERLYERVDSRFRARDYAAARAMLDRALRNHFTFPIARIIVWQLYLKVALAQDDVPAAERCASRLRHNGGDGWKYRTAYFYVLLYLDWGELSAATAEYEQFRNACASSAIYRTRIEVLDALFARINGRESVLPDAAKDSCYPIVHRVVDRYCP